MSVKLSATLPSDDRNGIGAIARSLIDAPDDVHVIVALVRTKEIRTRPQSGEVVPTAEVLALEAFTGVTEDATTLHRLLRRQHERRTGQVELPLELEEAIDALLAKVDEEPDADDGEPDAAAAPPDGDELPFDDPDDDEGRAE